MWVFAMPQALRPAGQARHGTARPDATWDRYCRLDIVYCTRICVVQFTEIPQLLCLRCCVMQSRRAQHPAQAAAHAFPAVRQLSSAAWHGAACAAATAAASSPAFRSTYICCLPARSSSPGTPLNMCSSARLAVSSVGRSPAACPNREWYRGLDAVTEQAVQTLSAW